MNTWFTANTNFSDHHGWNNKVDRIAQTLFATVEARDEAVIQRWNAHVQPFDRVYVLGDVGFDKFALETILPRLNGNKRLILGEHDHIGRYPALTEHFKKIFLTKDFGEFVCSHMPLMRSLLRNRRHICVHGHMHKESLKKFCQVDKRSVYDPQYLNICLENTDYTPLSLADLQSRVAVNQKRLLP